MNKRILFFISSLTGGGAERVTSKISHFMVNRGHSVSIITMRGTERDFYAIPKEVDRISLELAGENWGIGKVFANSQRLLALRATLKQEQADVVGRYDNHFSNTFHTGRMVVTDWVKNKVFMIPV